MESTETLSIDAELQGFLDKCKACGSCTGACALLNNRGAPDRLIANHDHDVFLCSGCGACSGLCPERLLPSDALLLAKHRLLKTGRFPDRILKAVQAARRFVQWGHSFSFAHYSRTDTVFWPGCSLAGISPDIVRKTQQLLSAKLGTKVGIALDCCSNPMYQMGDFDFVRDSCAGIRNRLEKRKITTIVSGCTNCVKILRREIPDMRVDHVLEVLSPAAAQLLAGQQYYLHHPCPTYCLDPIQARARTLLEELGAIVVEQRRPCCCGFGGNVTALSPELADAAIEKIMTAAGKASIVTYCMSCKDRFLLKGNRAYHLLELIVSAAPVKRPIFSAQKWFNRFILMLEMRLATMGIG